MTVTPNEEPSLEFALNHAIDSGAAFLRRSLESRDDHRWLDFPAAGISPGSTEWVSALVCALLGEIPETRALGGPVCVDLLRRARKSGGWGYRDSVFEDCDSTAWVLLAAKSNEITLPMDLKRRSVEFILSHQTLSGGFRTYGDWVKPHLNAERRAGWFEAEVSVTGAAVLALVHAGLAGSSPVRRACEYLLSMRAASAWKPYWWGGEGYTAHCALRALLSAAGDAADVKALASMFARQCITDMQRGIELLETSESEPPNCHAISVAVLTWGLCELPGRLSESEVIVTATARQLLHAQLENGAFPAATELVVPGGVQGKTLRLLDTGIVTSAWTLRALHEARSIFRSTASRPDRSIQRRRNDGRKSIDP